MRVISSVDKRPVVKDAHPLIRCGGGRRRPVHPSVFRASASVRASGVAKGMMMMPAGRAQRQTPAARARGRQSGSGL